MKINSLICLYARQKILRVFTEKNSDSTYAGNIPDFSKAAELHLDS